MEKGAPGVVLKSRGMEAYFARAGAERELKQGVRKFLRGIAKLSRSRSEPRAEWRVVQAESWENSWKRFIKPRRVGKSFWVRPPWIAAAKSSRRHVITIEPGMAFGTGTHATTMGCLEFLERAAASLEGRRFDALDVGTGSGILAIALAKLGARRVWAIDNDPVALRVARQNIRSNGVARVVRLSAAKLHQIKKRYPLVVANLTAETILQLAAGLKGKVAAHGSLILSGILCEKAAAVARRFVPGFRVYRRRRRGEWATLWLRRK